MIGDFLNYLADEINKFSASIRQLNLESRAEARIYTSEIKEALNFTRSYSGHSVLNTASSTRTAPILVDGKLITGFVETNWIFSSQYIGFGTIFIRGVPSAGRKIGAYYVIKSEEQSDPNDMYDVTSILFAYYNPETNSFESW